MVYGVILTSGSKRRGRPRSNGVGQGVAACTHACAETAQPHKSLRKAPGQAQDLEVPETSGVAAVVWVMALGRRASSRAG
jgi:hypothetical protein